MSRSAAIDLALMIAAFAAATAVAELAGAPNLGTARAAFASGVKFTSPPWEAKIDTVSRASYTA